MNVIVRYTRKAQAQDHANISQQGGSWKRNLDVINSAAYSMPSQSIEGLSRNPLVAHISTDRRIASSMDYANPAVQADIARQYGWNGTGVTVAVIDSGITSSHPDLMDSTGASRVVYSESFISEPSGTSDQYGHGTHVAGILGGNATQSTGPGYVHSFWGIAPKVRFVNLKVLDSNGAGNDSDVIEAIQRAIALKDTYNIRIINLSLGRPVMESYTVDPLCQAVEQAWQAGIVVVVAAGNQGRNNSVGTFGYSTIGAPGNDPYVITVGAMKDAKTATRADDQMASYSSKGPTLLDGIAKPDLVAPGNRIISALPANGTLTSLYPANIVPNSYYISGGNAQPSNSYFELSGTSMATPIVAGAAALLLQQNPNLTPDQIKAKLMKTATKNFPLSSVSTDPVTGLTYTIYYDLFTVGAGYLDIWAALTNTDTISADKKATSPSVKYSTLLAKVLLTHAANVVWGDLNLGLNIVWGDHVLLANNIVWGNHAVWATSGDDGFNIVWGDNVVWGDSAASAESARAAVRGER